MEQSHDVRLKDNSSAAVTDDVDQCLNAFDRHLESERGCAPSTRAHYLHEVRCFLVARNRAEVSRVLPGVIEEFSQPSTFFRIRPGPPSQDLTGSTFSEVCLEPFLRICRDGISRSRRPRRTFQTGVAAM